MTDYHTGPIRVRVSIPCMPTGRHPALPNEDGSYGKCIFHINPTEDIAFDFWVVMGFAYELEEATVAPKNTLFICGEPPEKKLFPRKFYQQFAHVIDTHSHSRHKGLILSAPCLGHGVQRPFDELDQLKPSAKDNRLSVLCSSSAKTRGQKKRLKFLKWLKGELGDQIVHYGRGFNPIDERLDAILPYKYHLVLENSCSDHYWTEKLASSYIGWSYPIYYGCPNLHEYFPKQAYERIDIDQPTHALAAIQELLAGDLTPEQYNAMSRARQQCLHEYGVFTRIANLIEQLYRPGPPSKVRIRSYKYFRKRNQITQGLKRFLKIPD